MKPDAYPSHIHKFSCKPTGHDAARQRENQRRHRARVKGRIAELEAALSSTQRQLDEALQRVESLTEEVQRLQHALNSASQCQAPPAHSPDSCSAFADAPAAESMSDILREYCHTDSESVREEQPRLLPGPSSTRTEATGAVGSSEPAASAAPLPCEPQGVGGQQPQPQQQKKKISAPSPEDVRAPSPHEPGFDDPDDDHPLLPPPGAGESTIPCREAYLIIRDRSTPDLDLAAAAEWLRPGFRRATVPGTGCRVQTHVLFSFVDYITGL